MGLDMYLHAQRRFDPDSNKGQEILVAAGVTLADLMAKSQLDPREHSTEFYLSMWSHGSNDDDEWQFGTARSEAILTAANLLDFRTSDSPSGSLGYADGKIVVGVTCVYWRKANAIHAWFVDNVQDGVDNCDEYPVEGEQLARLAKVCDDAIFAYEHGDKVKAGEILTPREGFFFGGYDIDDWWAENARNTSAQIEGVVKLAAATPVVTFTYQSSW